MWKNGKTKTSEHHLEKRISCLVSVALGLKAIDPYLCYLQRIFKAILESFKSYQQSTEKNTLILTQVSVLLSLKSRTVNCFLVVALQP